MSSKIWRITKKYINSTVSEVEYTDMYDDPRAMDKAIQIILENDNTIEWFEVAYIENPDWKICQVSERKWRHQYV